MSDVVRIHQPERLVPGKRLGRHIFIDPRSASYPAQTALSVRSVKHASAGLPLNQDLPKPLGSCTANALVGALNSVPHWAPGQPTLREADALALYNAESILQGAGPVPPNDPGGSGTEVCQAALNAGMLTRYQSAAGIDQALLALVPRPVITGVNWFDSFDTPDHNGLISIAPGAQIRGGHEFVLDEIDAPSRIVWGWQSWGLPFGRGGRFGMSFDTWNQLLRQGGDVTVPRTAHGWIASPISA